MTSVDHTAGGHSMAERRGGTEFATSYAEQCGNTHRRTAYVCNRLKGHRGHHVALDNGGHVLIEWSGGRAHG
jgi:hypothetical protein